jgi:hypothetical protein
MTAEEYVDLVATTINCLEKPKWITESNPTANPNDGTIIVYISTGTISEAYSFDPREIRDSLAYKNPGKFVELVRTRRDQAIETLKARCLPFEEPIK